jgi:predicted nucleic acid-binding protein
LGLSYLDSCVVLNAIANPEQRGEDTRRAIEGAGENRLVISPLVDLECIVRPLRQGNTELISRVRQNLDRFRRVEITPRAYALATHLRAIHGLKTADALHASTASLSGCDDLWTTDDHLLRALPGFAREPLSGP